LFKRNAQFRNFKASIIYQTQSQVINMVTTTQALRDNIVSYTMDTNATWPLVIIPDFEARHVDFVSGNALDATITTTYSGGSTVTTTRDAKSNRAAVELVLLPLVATSDRSAWEAWAPDHDDWILDGIIFRAIYSGGSTESAKQSLKRSDGISPYIHQGTTIRETYPYDLEFLPAVVVAGDGGGTTTTTGINTDNYFLPVWQSSPIPVYPKQEVNYNSLVLPAFQEAFDVMKESKRSVLSKVLPIRNPEDEGDRRRAGPHSYLLEPIFETLLPRGRNAGEGSAVDSPSTTSARKNAKLVGVLRTTLDWSALFQDALPSGSNGVVVVLSNGATCGQIYSFQVNGPETVYLGEGDLHDINHGKLKQVASILPPSHYQNNSTMLSSYCPYTITIYPSSELERSYHSDTPLLFTSVVVLIFLLAACLFGCYDYMVEQRQATVAKTANRTKALVSSLFPEQVHSRLMNGIGGGGDEVAPPLGNSKRDSNSRFNNKNKKNSHDDEHDNTKDPIPKEEMGGHIVGHRTALSKTADMLYSKAMRQQQQQGEQSVIAFHSKPIADLFPSTTVMFCDIVNFTAWSSVREPTQVSLLISFGRGRGSSVLVGCVCVCVCVCVC
jgi:hypothetical protein